MKTDYKVRLKVLNYKKNIMKHLSKKIDDNCELINENKLKELLEEFKKF